MLSTIFWLILTSLHNYSDQADIPASYTRYNIANVKELHQALTSIKSHQGNAAIIFSQGIYQLKQTIIIDQPNVMLLSQSRDPKQVILIGRGMRKTPQVENLLDISSSGFVLDGITLKETANHLIQIRSEKNADAPIIRNCILQDGYEQLLKVSYDKKNRPNHHSDNGLIEKCIFQYTAGIGPNHYIGGIDAHGIRNWEIRQNVFKDIASPGHRMAEHAIHLWNNTQDNLVEHNIIIDSDRGIGFGMRINRKRNENKNIKFSNHGGVIRNNYIYHSKNNDPFADTGIVIEDSPNTLIEGNYIYLEHDYPRAIEYRFPLTKNVIIKNNFTNKNIHARNGGQGKQEGNHRHLTKSDFMKKLKQLDGLIIPAQKSQNGISFLHRLTL